MCTNLPSVFVSFSGRDTEDAKFANQLRIRLREQNIEIWYFEKKGHKIPITKDITEFCKKKIDKCKLFISLIPKTGFESDVTKEEVQYALHLMKTKKLPILPIYPHDLTTLEWDNDSLILFQKLQEMKGESINYNNFLKTHHYNQEMEYLIRQICDFLIIPYIPPAFNNLFPIYQRTYKELSWFKTRIKADAYENAMDKALACQGAYEKGNIEEAHFKLNSLLDTLADIEADNKNVKFYYPIIAQGILLLEKSDCCQQNGHGEEVPILLQKALNIFKGVEANEEIEKDENVYAAIGIVYFRLQEYEEALKFFKIALKKSRPTILTLKSYDDPDILYNILLTSLLCNQQININDFELIFNESFLREYLGLTENKLNYKKNNDYIRTINENNFIKFLVLKTIAYAFSGRDEESGHLYKILCEDEQLSSRTILHFSDFIAKCNIQSKKNNRKIKALKALENLNAKFGNLENPIGVQITHLLSRYYYELTLYDKALPISENLIEHFPENAQYLIETAQIYWKLKNFKKAKAVALIIEEKLFKWPDRYYIGFACWFLGDKSSARREFKISGRSQEEWYDTVMEDSEISLLSILPKINL